MNEKQAKRQQEIDIHRSAARGMIMDDLKKAGFEVAINLHGSIRVGLTSRKIFEQEVVSALECAGYDECQYEVSQIHGYVLVSPIVG
jgi:hypothetical protein